MKIEGALRGQIKQLKKRISETESNRENVEHTLHYEVEEMKATLRKGDIGSIRGVAER